jgi:CRISPR/Cas system type I-B associated protein Csh2 (Cas7 group RAMP superfamily)
MEKNVEVELRNSKTVLRDMAADILVQAEQEKQDVAEKYQKRKVKDDVCKDCDKIHSVQAEQEKQDVAEKCKDCNKIHSAPTPNCRLA